MNNNKKISKLSVLKDSIDVYIDLVEGMLDSLANSKFGRAGNSNRNDMMSRPTLMYLWYLVKQGKIAKVDSVYKSANSVSGYFLLIPMYDDEGKPTLKAIIPIVAKGEGYELGEYQNILFVSKLLNFEEVEGEFIRVDTGYVRECVECDDRVEYLECDKWSKTNVAFSITDSRGVRYLADPYYRDKDIITITEDNGKPELYMITGDPHNSFSLNDPMVKKKSDGYITQDIVVPMIHGIEAESKHVGKKDEKAVSYRYSCPVAKLMALASLFVSHERNAGYLAKHQNNLWCQYKARVIEWDMIEGFNKAVVGPFEMMFPNEDPLKVLTLAIDVFILAIFGDRARDFSDEIFRSILMLFSRVFGYYGETDLLEDLATPVSTIMKMQTWEWFSYFVSLQTAWKKTPFVNHKDLRRSHNVMYNLEFTSKNFNDAHGALVGALASSPSGSQYVETITVPCKKKVNGENVYSTKQMQVFKNHYGISAYILYQYDMCMKNGGATNFSGQFISQIKDIAVRNRKQINASSPEYLVIAPDEIDYFLDFLRKYYNYDDASYWKWV